MSSECFWDVVETTTVFLMLFDCMIDVKQYQVHVEVQLAFARSMGGRSSSIESLKVLSFIPTTHTYNVVLLSYQHAMVGSLSMFNCGKP